MSNAPRKTPRRYSDLDRAKWHVEAQRALRRVRARDAAARERRARERQQAGVKSGASK
jgi:hypothetical protein